MSPTLRAALRLAAVSYPAALAHLRGRSRELFALRMDVRDHRWPRACRLRFEMRAVVLDVVAVRPIRRVAHV